MPEAAVEEDMQHVRAGDVLVLNLGAHHGREFTFVRWQQYIGGVAALMGSLIRRMGVTVIWRTTFMTKEHVFRKKKWHGGCVRREVLQSKVWWERVGGSVLQSPGLGGRGEENTSPAGHHLREG